MLDLHPIVLDQLDFLEVNQQLMILFVALLVDLILEFEELIMENCINKIIG